MPRALEEEVMRFAAVARQVSDGLDAMVTSWNRIRELSGGDPAVERFLSRAYPGAPSLDDLAADWRRWAELLSRPPFGKDWSPRRRR